MIALLMLVEAAVASSPAMPGYLSGCWEQRSEDGRWTEECWNDTRGGLMIGSGRDGKGDKVGHWEWMRIERGADGSLTFFGSPKGTTAVGFKATEADATSITFVNPNHDYPQRVRYAVTETGLNAEVSLADGSKPNRWSYRRVQPAAQAGFIESIRSDPLKLITAILGALGTLVGVFLALRKAREDSLRRGEVLAWADECITTIENIIVGAVLFERPAFQQECRKRLIDAAFDAAALIERGRMFFKNQPFGSFGSEKPPAYRGFRPRVLDPLVAAHQIAVRFVEADGEARIKLQLLAEDYLKMFVSLVQKEIGRERTAAAETKKAGAGFQLQKAMDGVEAERIALVKQMKSQTQYRLRPATPETR